MTDLFLYLPIFLHFNTKVFFVFKKVQEKKKAQEAAKPDPDADYVDDDEDYGYDPELRYRDSYPRIRKKVVRCKTDSFLTCQTWNLCQA